MKKLLIQLLIAVFLFAGVWYLLSRIDFVHIFKIEQFRKDSEKKFGKFIYEDIKGNSDEVCPNKATNVPVVIERRICQANGLDPDRIKVHIIPSSEINAVSIPGDQIVVYSGLIEYCKTPEELAGVMAHETVHIVHNHVTKKMMRNLFLYGIARSRGASELAKDFASTAFDRTQESDADETAVGYLLKAQIDPKGLVLFFDQYSKEKDHLPSALVWLSNHPETDKRAAAVRRLIPASYNPRTIVSKKEWKDFKLAVSRIK